MKHLNKKGGIFDELGALGVGLATLAIVMVVVFLILDNLSANSAVTADSNASQAVTDMTSAADDIPDWVPIVVVAVIGALLLGLVAYFKR